MYKKILILTCKNTHILSLKNPSLNKVDVDFFEKIKNDEYYIKCAQVFCSVLEIQARNLKTGNVYIAMITPDQFVQLNKKLTIEKYYNVILKEDHRMIIGRWIFTVINAIITAYLAKEILEYVINNGIKHDTIKLVIKK